MNKYNDHIKAIKNNYPTSGYSALCEALDCAVDLMSKEMESAEKCECTLQEPCEYCDEKSAGKLILSTRGNVQLKVGKKTGVEYYDDVYGWQDEAFEFKFCPMCGRKLEVEG